MSAAFSLPFESPVQELESKLAELEAFSKEQDIDVSHEIRNMKEKIEQTRNNIYANLSAWQKVQVARHPDRPYTMDYIKAMTTDFVEIHGDRIHRDDRAIVGGFAKIDGRKVMILGSQKGRDTKSNVECNFGCAHPEGYRKALRLMKLADKFGVPIITLIDTKGAYAGLESEERHIAEAIAVNLRESFNIKVPIICVIIGEGGSGGALGIGIGNRILILEHAYYSVISPEGCAAILWKDRAYSDKAAEALKITGRDLIKLKLADEVIPEPKGGAHSDPAAAAANIKSALLKHLDELGGFSAAEIMQERYDKFRAMGAFSGSVE
jgi:acetyl-CoA carboxylase carboxyl transferase subunit alpha